MVKYIDKAGIPIVHICTVTPISLSVGANRVVPGISIPYPAGNPGLPAEEEFMVRKAIIGTALKALATDIEDQTLFPLSG